MQKKVYNSARWQKIRRAVLKKNNFTCEICSGFANSVHHIVAIKDGGSLSFDNLISLCRRCHGIIDAKKGVIKKKGVRKNRFLETITRGGYL